MTKTSKIRRKGRTTKASKKKKITPYKFLACKCGTIVEVTGLTKSVMCPTCTARNQLKKYGWPKGANILTEEEKIKRPAGWHFMKEFVDEAGNVFHKGIKQPDLFGTLPPTKIKPKVKKIKLNKREKSEGFRRVSVEIRAINSKIEKIIAANKKYGLKKLEKELKIKKKELSKYI